MSARQVEIRRFTLIDAMTLVAATAVPFVLIREYLDYLRGRHVFLLFSGDWRPAAVWRWATIWSGVLRPWPWP